MGTTNVAPSLRVAGPDDVDEVANIVADAFLNLDVIRFLVPDLARRWPVSRAWYELWIAHAISDAGQVVMTEGAAAVWFDRTTAATEPHDYARRLAELAGPDLPQFQHLDAQMDKAHPTDPHRHLLFLAVLPDRQNHGLGSLLLQHTHAQLDDAGVAAYLEATGEDNRRLYARHGYTDMDPPTIAASGDIVLHRMWREPEGVQR
ncbi:GNAT family N-acetyltransferase [Actinoplanes sp. NPDC051861]|uniref:GNAT family N-acetyltransferase n=1 Tax=Actinoplanes sp. NPDC051861 TaxID=3155170 RepID=UPI00343B901F